jgi:hypothetical protein
MNRTIKRLGVALCLAATAVAGSGCAVGFVDSAPTNVTATGATLNGSVGSDRSEQAVYWFEYGASTGYGNSTPKRTLAVTANVQKPVSEAISGLTGGTEYHYRICTRDDDPSSRVLCSKDATFDTAGVRPDRPRYLLHLGATDGTQSDPQSGIAQVAISVDGRVVDTKQPDCTASQNCGLDDDWTFKADNYEPGTHTVTVRATDGVGRVTSSDLQIEIQRDTTQPNLAVSGPLKAAPQGWVEQRSYTVTGTAKDSGYGVTNLKLLIDGQQVGQESIQPCPDGGCELSRTFTVNAANYDGGAHPVKLVATDGAGNTTSSGWTMNVNPDGNISTAEATATLLALDATSGSTTVVPATESDDPAALGQSGSALTSTGAPVVTDLTTDPRQGFEIDTPEITQASDDALVAVSDADDGITVIPTAVAESATTAGVANGVAAVSGGTASEVDTAIRPIFDGVMAFETIRDASSPEAFSWRVTLDSGQTLRSINSQNAGVYYEDGTPAMGISAERAHDATGTTVPTSLTVSSGNVITLTVSHRSDDFVYPIVAGTGWENGYVATVLPPTGNPVVDVGSAPEAVSLSEAGIAEFDAADRAVISSRSTTDVVRRRWAQVQCNATAGLDLMACGDPWRYCGPTPPGRACDKPGGPFWNAGMKVTYYVKKFIAVWHKGGPSQNVDCATIPAEWDDDFSNLVLHYRVHETRCEWLNKIVKAPPYGPGGGRLIAHANWHLTMWDGTKWFDRGYIPLTFHFAPNGYRSASQTSCPGAC